MKKLVAIICILAFISACMGTHPRPIETFKPGDDKRSCESIQMEILMLEAEVKKKESDHKNKVVLNTINVIGGILILPVFFFLIDGKSDHRVEAEACVVRREALAEIAAVLECGFIEGVDFSRDTYVVANNYQKFLNYDKVDPNAELHLSDPNFFNNR